MALPANPPEYPTWSALVAPIERSERGWRAYALQSALRSLGADLIADGVFGPATEQAVLEFQQANGLTVDGISGARTQVLLISKLGKRTHQAQPRVPDGLMRGYAEGEGANVLAATNWTVIGGVDCGIMQYRVYGPPYDAARLRFAFDAQAAMTSAARDFLATADRLARNTWVMRQGDRRSEWAKRLAVLAHNWPVAAQAWSFNGTCSNPNGLAIWAPTSARFPDGAPVLTRRDWCEFYALGGPHGEGAITKYVRAW
jgi:hypothetical protein